MDVWLESFGVLLLAAGGMFTGAWFSRLPKLYWLIGYLLPLLVILIFAIGSRVPSIAFIPPVSWMMMGRIKYMITGFVGAMILTTLLLKLPNRRDRLAVSLLMICLVFATSIWPFLAPAFNRTYLASLVTRVDHDGICLQNTPYTCGPASAVTALRKLGFTAEESEIAMLAHTTSAIGTPPDILALVLAKRYGKDGLTVEYRHFKNIDELQTGCLMLAVVKYNLILDHYVTVLSVNNQEVIVGDPLNGLNELSRAGFDKEWRFEGVVLRRK